MIVDFHTHITPPHVIQSREKYLGLAWCWPGCPGGRYPKSRVATLHDCLV